MTTHVVADETLGMIARKQWDLFRRVKEGTLDPEKVSDALQAVIEDRFDGARVISTFLRDMAVEANWELVEDVGGDPVSADQLELVSFLKRGESSVRGEEMKKRAKRENASLGQRQAEYLREHQEIPPEWRNYYLVFPGTVWRAPYGHLGVPYLVWHGDRWKLHFDWLEYDWDSGARLVRPSK